MQEDSPAFAISRRFLWLGVIALGIAGLFAITLVVGRTPQLAALTVFQQLFTVALVVHVDLSVLVWFLCVGAMGWSLLIARQGRPWPYWQGAGFALTAAATACIALSPLERHWDIVKSNYVPVLDNHLFLTGLALLLTGMSVVLLQLVATYLRPHLRRALSYVDLGWLYAGFITALAIVAFLAGGYFMPDGLARNEQFGLMFWAGGHILQFAYTALMMGAWLLLLQQITGVEEKSFWIFIAYALLAVGAIASFAGFALYDPVTPEFEEYQSNVMINVLGLAPVLMAVIVVGGFLRFARKQGSSRVEPDNAAFARALLMSFVVFFAGGLLGMMIRGQNVTIPAHYHGEIVGVTLALMGAAYAMLPRFGYPAVAHWRIARWQPVVYGIGQLMHIGGLAYSGGYGVLRKTPDAAATLAPNLKIAMGIMGLGGLLAIIGGLLFVVVMVMAWLESRRGRA